jgi:hypothetical protein
VGFYVSMIAAYSTPWTVCETCVPLIEADSKAARRYAAAGREPPGCGAVEGKIASIPAAYGWSLVHNEWPISVQVGKNAITHDPSVGTRCDFCRRIVYGDEKFGLMDTDAYKAQLDGGVAFARKPPPSGKLQGKDSWIACFTCLDK